MDTADRDTAKELYYHLGRALEQLGDVGGADQAYSQVMQWDFKYRDVRQRVQQLRQARKSDPAGPVGPVVLGFLPARACCTCLQRSGLHLGRLELRHEKVNDT